MIEDTVSPIEPLTKAKLFTQGIEEGSWTEIGVGIVSVQVASSSTEDGAATQSGSGKAGSAGSGDAGDCPPRVGKLLMVDLEDPAEVMLSTFLTLEDVYMVQQDTILIWTDPQLGRDMACSFNTKEGCEDTIHKIREFQRTAEDAGSVESPRTGCHPSDTDLWTVTVEHLPGILEAATTASQRFGIYVRDHPDYFKQLVDLFDACASTRDVASRETIAQLTVVLLQVPYSTDGKIVAQLVEESVVDKCIDMVQCGLGRRDKASGFISFEERRATFRDPCHLPETLLARVHVLYSCSFLKDLLPLSLDDSDVSFSSPIAAILLRFKYTLMEDICRSPTILPQAFMQAQSDGEGAVGAVLAFAYDMAKSIKSVSCPLDVKEELFSMIVQAGLLSLVNAALRQALELHCDGSVTRASNRSMTEFSCGAASGSATPDHVLQMCCDIVNIVITMMPSARETLLSECKAAPKQCTLALLIEVLMVQRTSGGLQAAVDAALSCCTDLIPFMADFNSPVCTAQRKEVLQFWVDGGEGESPPLFRLGAHLAALLASVSGEREQRRVLEPFVERQVLYGLKVMIAVTDEASSHLSASLADVLALAQVLPALTAALRMPSRRMSNIHSSIIALLSCFVKRGGPPLLALLQNNDDVLHAVMELFLRNCHRRNILCASLGCLLTFLCDGVHQYKVARPVQQISSPYVHLMNSEDSTGPETVLLPQAEHQNMVSRLLQSYGAQLHEACPVLAAKLQHSLQETPEEAQRAEAETSSVTSATSTLDLGLHDRFDFSAVALELGYDVLARSPSSSPIVADTSPSDLLPNMLLKDDSGQSSGLSDNEEGDDECVPRQGTENVSSASLSTSIRLGVKRVSDNENEEEQHLTTRARCEEE